MSLLAIIGIVFGAAVLFILLCYAFVGVISFPAFLLGLFGRIILFPISLIGTYIYPVGILPYLVTFGFILYLIFMFVSKVFNMLGYKK